VERTDVLNAAALAAVLLLMGFVVLSLVGRLSDTVDGGIVDAQGSDELLLADTDLGPTSPLLRPPNEVSVRVGNGSDGRKGLAGRATRKLDSAGYGTLEAKNKEGTPIDDSSVYYIDGYKVDAIQIAALLNIAEPRVRPLRGDPGLPTDGADVIVVLGQNADF
jgi:hypothetical protein